MADLKSPIPDSEEDTEDDVNDEDEEDEEQEYWEQAETPVHPNNTALIEFVDSVVPSGELDWVKDADAIFDRYPALGRTSEPTGKTVLHLLIEAWVRNANSPRKWAPIKKAFIAIFNRYPELVRIRDGLDQDPSRVAGQTVLYSAMIDGGPCHIAELLFKDRALPSGKKYKWSDDPVAKEVANSIGVMCGARSQEENALHLALRKPELVSAKTLRRIVRRANTAAVAAADKYGYTPLHYAVDYAQCSEAQYELVKILLSTGENPKLIESSKAVLDFVTHAKKLSVYQHHVETRERFRETAVPAKANLSKTKREEDLRALKQQEEAQRRLDREQERERRRELQERRRRELEQAGQDPKSDSEGERDKAGRPTRTSSRPDKASSAARPREDPQKQGPSGRGPPGPPGPLSADPRSRGPGRGDREAPGKDGPSGRGRETRSDPRAVPGAREDSQEPRAEGRREARELDPKTLLKVSATNSISKDIKEEETAEDRKAKRDYWSEEMKLDIKTQYLRSRSHNKCVEFLYGKNRSDIQISFEYSGLALEADAYSFTQSFNNVTFDNVLKYVAFPAVHVKDWRDKPERLAPLEKARGRFDMLFFFNWLREKRVKRILKVIVEDNEQPPHSDEAIELALQGFDVETLDWSKPDLEPETICNACDKLKDVVLHWSGNNAVLRAWSDPEGLRKLSKLSVINLIVDDTLETTERTKRYILEFEKRLQTPYAAFVPPKEEPAVKDAEGGTAGATDKDASGKTTMPNMGIRRSTTTADVVVNAGKTDEVPPSRKRAIETASADPGRLRTIAVKKGLEGLSLRRKNGGIPGSPSSADAARRATPPHHWLDAIDAFAEQMDNLWRFIVKERTTAVSIAVDEVIRARGAIGPAERAEIEAAKGPPADIIVAVIDDGVDTTVGQLSGRVLTGRTFSYDEQSDRVRPWYVSEKNHGTIMASMVVRVCRNVKIYPIRLATTRSGAIDSMSAAQAIDAAVDRGADIISMSWTVSPPPQPEVKQAFDAALQRAIDKNVLMFCSAKDSGHVTDQYYPAGYRPDSVIKVGAASPAGLPYDLAGSLDRLDFIFPGVEVVQQHGEGPAGIADLKQTGSSVATALGAGLAAMVMYCARVAQITGGVLTAADFEKLRQRNTMMDAIARFGRSSSPQSEGKFIEVWNRLEGRTRLLQREGSKSAKGRESIAQLARDLVNTST